MVNEAFCVFISLFVSLTQSDFRFHFTSRETRRGTKRESVLRCVFPASVQPRLLTD